MMPAGVATRTGRAGGPWRRRSFRAFYLGQSLASLGGAMTPVAVAFAVLNNGGTSAQLSLLLAARYVPMILLLILGGTLADRWSRGQALVIASLLLAAAQGMFAVAILAHVFQPLVLAVFNAIAGAAYALYIPAARGLVPLTVDKEDLRRANSLISVANSTTTIGGAALAGVAVSMIGPGWTLALTAACFGAAAVLRSAIRIPNDARAERDTMLSDLRRGWREFAARRWVWSIVIQFGVVNAVTSAAIEVIGPTVAHSRLGGAGVWGVILAFQSIGLVLGGLVSLRLKPRRPLYLGCLAVLLLSLPALALSEPSAIPVICAAMLLAGIGSEVFGVSWATTIQQEIPSAMLSRIYAYDAIGSFALTPLALAAVGPVVEVTGARAALLGCVALVVISTLAVLLGVSDVRMMRQRTVDSA